MLVGKYEHKLDAAGRLAIPARLRITSARLSESLVFYLSRGLNGCLCAYTELEMETVVKGLTPKAAPGLLVLKRNRLFLASVYAVTADAQGRIVVPTELRNLAKIQEQGEVVILGMGTHIEIWAKDRWLNWEAQESDKYDEAEELIAGYTRAELPASMISETSGGSKGEPSAEKGSIES